MTRLLLLFLSSALVRAAELPPRFGTNGAVATVNGWATLAGINALKAKGNAVDAAVAAALTLGVVDGHNSGIGGGCFLLIRTPAGKVIAIDGRETAPAAATRDMFLRDGKADPELSQDGALSIAVPGALAAYDYALKNFGKLTLKTHLLAAARIADEGFPVSYALAQAIFSTLPKLREFADRADVFEDSKGNAIRTGAILKLPDLARSYRAIAEGGIGWFYEGAFAAKTEDWMRRNGGLIRATDFKKYQVKIREAVLTTYRGYSIYGFPPPSSGGVHVAQILNILEQCEPAKLKLDSVRSVHLIIEAMKLAFADRAHWLGDPDFAKVPRGLISKEYAKTLALKIAPSHASVVPAHNIPPNVEDTFQKHTTHFSTADAEGTWVACTATINTSFGAKVIIPGTGIVMNNEMDDFAAQPGVPNYFGLRGADANAVGPGKRPLSSMSPTIVAKDGKPILSVGGAGGPTIISQTVLNIIGTIDYGLNISQALGQRRFHHQWLPDELKVENFTPEDIVETLEKMGHKIRVAPPLGISQGVAAFENGFNAATDPRTQGLADAW